MSVTLDHHGHLGDKPAAITVVGEDAGASKGSPLTASKMCWHQNGTESGTRRLGGVDSRTLALRAGLIVRCESRRKTRKRLGAHAARSPLSLRPGMGLDWSFLTAQVEDGFHTAHQHGRRQDGFHGPERRGGT
jgi:hypothetical protein